jgi:hypothetical protein
MATLPSKIDMRNEMPLPLDQKTLGSCASNAASNSLRYLLRKEKRYDFQPSRLFIYYNTRVKIENFPANEDTGVCIRDVCKALKTYYACNEVVWPYILKKFSEEPSIQAYTNAKLHLTIRYSFVPQDLLSIKNTLYSGLPIMIGIQVFESIESDQTMQTGIIPFPDLQNELYLGGHKFCV